ncbi:MAG: HU family DNA-binding protein [Bacteroidales bacterium]
MIKFVKVQRNIQVGATPGIKFLARLFRGNDVSMDQLCQEITESTTVSYPDVLACLKSLEITVSRHIQNGSAVKLNYLGSFIPSIKVKAQTNLESVDASTIQSAKCRFYASPDFKRSLAKTGFAEANLEIKGLQ